MKLCVNGKNHKNLDTISINGYRHYDIEYLKVSKLLATELHDLEKADNLFAKILDAGIWTTPILVEYSSLAVMDGHHRLAVALLLGLKRVPAVRIRYDDPRVILSAWRLGDSYCPQDIINAALSGTLFPIKSTRHDLAVPLPRVSVPLTDLGLTAY